MGANFSKVFLVVCFLASLPLAAENPPPDHEGEAGRPVMVPPNQIQRRIKQLENACYLGRGVPPYEYVAPAATKPSAGTGSPAAATASSPAGVKPEPPASNDAQFALLSKGLSKCGPCHKTRISGTTLENAQFFFEPGSVQGDVGEVKASQIIGALKNITEMNNVDLTPEERGAIEAWSKFSK